MCLSVHFLIMPKAPAINGSVIVFRSHIFSISISRSLYLLICSYSWNYMILSVGTDLSVRRYAFLL